MLIRITENIDVAGLHRHARSEYKHDRRKGGLAVTYHELVEDLIHVRQMSES